MKSAFFLIFLAACGGPLVPPRSEVEIAQAHKAACVAKAEVDLSLGRTLRETCETTAARLAELVTTDSDCRAYFGDVEVTIADLCDVGNQ